MIEGIFFLKLESKFLWIFGKASPFSGSSDCPPCKSVDKVLRPSRHQACPISSHVKCSCPSCSNLKSLCYKPEQFGMKSDRLKKFCNGFYTNFLKPVESKFPINSETASEVCKQLVTATAKRVL